MITSQAAAIGLNTACPRETGSNAYLIVNYRTALARKATG